MRKVKKWTKLIEKTKKKIDKLSQKLENERKKMEAGKISRAKFSHIKARIATHERELWGKIRRYEKLRVRAERALKEKKKKGE